jgi:IS30 family transposase
LVTGPPENRVLFFGAVASGANLVLRRPFLSLCAWSPEQIAQRLRLMKPDDLSAHVSYETIYAAIYAQPRGGLKAAMIEALRQRSVVPTGEHKTASYKGTSINSEPPKGTTIKTITYRVVIDHLWY